MCSSKSITLEYKSDFSFGVNKSFLSFSCFDNKLKYAQSFSAKKQVIIEQYMDCDDVSFEYKIQNGEVILSAICDREIYKTTEFGSITSRLIYPSKYINVYLQEVNQKVINMFHCMHLSDGVLFMQAFVKNNQFYFYEMGYRLSGGRHYIFTENQNTTNACKELIHFALTGKMAEQQLSQIAEPNFKDLCIQLSIICQSQTIHHVEGWDYIMNIRQIIDATKYFAVGDTIGQQGTTASIFARLHIVCENEQEYSNVLQEIKSNLKVYNALHENIIIDL
jgi:biotin carboxylase